MLYISSRTGWRVNSGYLLWVNLSLWEMHCLMVSLLCGLRALVWSSGGCINGLTSKLSKTPDKMLRGKGRGHLPWSSIPSYRKSSSSSSCLMLAQGPPEWATWLVFRLQPLNLMSSTRGGIHTAGFLTLSHSGCLHSPLQMFSPEYGVCN